VPAGGGVGKAQPFLDDEAKEKWLDRKAAYKELRSTGRA
jgi:hypothetical protein